MSLKYSLTEHHMNCHIENKSSLEVLIWRPFHGSALGCTEPDGGPRMRGELLPSQRSRGGEDKKEANSEVWVSECHGEPIHRFFEFRSRAQFTHTYGGYLRQFQRSFIEKLLVHVEMLVAQREKEDLARRARLYRLKEEYRPRNPQVLRLREACMAPECINLLLHVSCPHAFPPNKVVDWCWRPFEKGHRTIGPLLDTFSGLAACDFPSCALVRFYCCRYESMRRCVLLTMRHASPCARSSCLSL